MKEKENKPAPGSRFFSFSGLYLSYLISHTSYFLLFLTPLLLILSYPKFNLGFLAWVAMAPLTLRLLSAKNVGEAAAAGFKAGFFFNLGILYWIYPTCRAGEVPVLFSLAAWMLLSAVIAVEWAIFALLAARLKKPCFSFPFAAAAAWTAVEWAKVAVTSKAAWFPWFLLGYTQWQYPVLLQISSVTGTSGLSFAIAFFGISLGYVLWKQSPVQYKLKLMALPVFILLSILFYGISELRKYPEVLNPKSEIRILNSEISLPAPGGQADLASRTPHSAFLNPKSQIPNPKLLRVAVLQPNIDLYKKWDAGYARWIQQRLEALLKDGAEKSPRIVIWPESALPGWIEEEGYKAWISSFCVGMDAFHLVGSVSERDGKHVSAFLFDAKGRISGIYDKRQLVPFGEYVPMRAVLGRWISAIGKLGEFEAGTKEQPLLAADGYLIGTAICYESIFPCLLRENSRAGADFLVNITNDGWYLDTAAPCQHFLVNVFRAVENRRPLVRAGNTGISGWIDEAGRVRSASELNTHGISVFDVPLRENPQKTFYSRHGDWFGVLCAVCSAALLFSAVFL